MSKRPIKQQRERASTLGTCLITSALAMGIVATPSIAHAQEPPGDTSNEERLAEARRQFDAGVSLLDDPDGAKYEDAYRAFKRAYELSKSAKVLGNIGFCAMKLERDGEAIDAYTNYLRDVPDVEEREKAQIQKDLATLTSTVSRMQITIKDHAPGKFTVVDRRIQTRGGAIENAYTFEGTEYMLRLRPGRHAIQVSMGRETSAPFELTIGSGGIASHEFKVAMPSTTGPEQPTAAQPKSKPSYVGPIVLGAVGLAGIGAGVVTGILAKNKTQDIESSCPNDTCPTSFDLAGNRTKAKTLGTVADISFISGGALLGGAIVWWLVTAGSSSGSVQTGRASASLSASKSSGSSLASWLTSTSAMCTHSGCGVSLQRGF